MDVRLLITLALLHQVTASGNWTCDFESSLCGMITDEEGGCWRTTVPIHHLLGFLSADFFCGDGKLENTSKITLPRDFDSGRWQLSFRYSSWREDGFLNVTSDCEESVPVTLDTTGRNFMDAKLDFICSSDFKISFIAVRQTGLPIIGIDDISVSRYSVTPWATQATATDCYTCNRNRYPDGPSPVIVAMVSIATVTAVGTMVTIVIMFLQRRISCCAT